MQSTFVLYLLAIIASVSIPRISAHGLITAVQGSNGNIGTSFGFDENTPRDGSKKVPFQGDTSIIRDREIASGKASPCGRTLAGGVNDMATSMAKAESAGLPSVGADGKVRMTIHQVNQDGAGPYKCDVDTAGDGSNFQPMKVDKNVPGFASLSRVTATDIPLVASMPSGTTCTGGADGKSCVIRCRNPAIAGPFGSCTAVTQAN